MAQSFQAVAEGVYDRGDGSLLARTWRGGPSKTFRDADHGGRRKCLATAKTWRADAIAKRARGEVVVVGSALTVAEEVDRWLTARERYVAVEGKGAETARVYRIRYRLDVLGTPFGKRPTDQLDRDEVEAWLHSLVDGGLGVGAANVSLSIVRRALDAAMDGRRLAQNAAARAKPITAPRREVRDAPERAEVDRVIAALLPRYTIVAQLALAAGLRFGEICGLRPEDVDAAARVIHVRQQYARSGSRRGMTLPKGNKTRVVPVPASLVMAVRTHVAHYGVSSAGTIVSTDRGAPLCDGTWRAAWKRACRIAKSTNLPGIHALRHAFGSYHVAAGETIANVSKWMGHASIEITMRTYLHPTPDARPETDLLASPARTTRTRRALNGNPTDG